MTDRAQAFWRRMFADDPNADVALRANTTHRDAEDQSMSPMPIDERVNPPTPTQVQGIEGDIVGSMWDDPIALLGYSPGIIRHGVPTEFPAIGTYSHGRSNHPDVGERWRRNLNDDRIRLSNEHFAGTPFMDEPTAVGRHEFRHRGRRFLADLADEYGIRRPLADTATLGQYNRMRSSLEEDANIMEDRRLGADSIYPGRKFTPPYERTLNRVNEYHRGIADDILRARVRELYATGRWPSDAARP